MAFDRSAHRRFVMWLGGMFGVCWLALAWAPTERDVWLLENVLTVAAVAGIVATFNHLTLSRISYTCLFVFLLLHTIGSHYTYSRMPYDAIGQYVFGVSLDEQFGFSRNHYDRFVHFCYGLLLAYPAREIFLRVAHVRGFWGYTLPLMLTLASSAAYELIEWAAAIAFGGELGMDYVGTQGDVWDSHKDMALAATGATVTMIVVAGINSSLQRDFHDEWVDSLRVKDEEPLGETAVARLWQSRGG
jgi:putative membrane protein